MAHPTRLFIVDELFKGERCVCELTEMVGADISTVSKHLSILKNAGIVKDEKRGQQVFYRLLCPCVLEFFGCVEEIIGYIGQVGTWPWSDNGGDRMNWKNEWKTLLLLAGFFLAVFYLPVGRPRFDNAVFEALHLVKWYAREHVLLCLIPALFIAGAISVFVSQASVMRFLGPTAPKGLAYGVASVSGSILAVCSCTVLPLFAGIYRMGAGLGPGLGLPLLRPGHQRAGHLPDRPDTGARMGIARTVGAVVFSVVIGLLMHFIFRKEELAKVDAAMAMPPPEKGRPLSHTILFFASMVCVLVFANWARPTNPVGFFSTIFEVKWILTSISAVGFFAIVTFWYGLKAWKSAVTLAATAIAAVVAPHEPLVPFATAMIGLAFFTSTQQGEVQEWFAASWGFAKQIMPLLLGGVLFAGLMLGRPGQEGIVPNAWVAAAVGGNSFMANFFSAVAGAFMYFATLTEIPILQGLLGSGMGKGPALALLLAGPALSLPSMLVLNSIMGFKKTFVYCSLVVILSTFVGMMYGFMFA